MCVCCRRLSYQRIVRVRIAVIIARVVLLVLVAVEICYVGNDRRRSACTSG